MSEKETQQEQVNRLLEKVNEAGVDGPFVPVIALAGLIFKANVVVAKEVLGELGLEDAAQDTEMLLGVARTMMERIQLVAPVETMGSGIARPTQPVPMIFPPGFGGRRNN